MKWYFLFVTIILVSTTGMACICQQASFFSLERFDNSALVIDFRYDSTNQTAEILNRYKGEVADIVPVNSAGCNFRHNVIYHVYFKEYHNNKLDLTAAIRCLQLYQKIEDYLLAHQLDGPNPENYNAFSISMKRNNQELVLLRALANCYQGPLKAFYMIEDDIMKVEDFIVVKGKFKRGKRKGKWICYEPDGLNWNKVIKRY